MMFVVNNKFRAVDYQFIELVVHCDLRLYRRKGPGSAWEVHDLDGKWREELYLDEIISELYDKTPDDYSWTDDTDLKPKNVPENQEMNKLPIIEDSLGCTAFEWKRGEGVVFPKL